MLQITVSDQCKLRAFRREGRLGGCRWGKYRNLSELGKTGVAKCAGVLRRFPASKGKDGPPERKFFRSFLSVGASVSQPFPSDPAPGPPSSGARPSPRVSPCARSSVLSPTPHIEPDTAAASLAQFRRLGFQGVHQRRSQVVERGVLILEPDHHSGRTGEPARAGLRAWGGRGRRHTRQGNRPAFVRTRPASPRSRHRRGSSPPGAPVVR